MLSLGVIGYGGFGTVDRVRDQQGNEFARKTFSVNQPLAPELQDNVLRRFKKEVRTQSGVSHQNIVPILSSDLNSQPPYYLMPLASSTLQADIDANRTLNGSFVGALSDIVAGLEVLHGLHIYHRDLKPQNVLRFRDFAQGQDFYAISDFGLVSLQESQLSVLTSTGMARGADHYTAPEVTQDLRHASIQSDIYSLGCILHEFVGIAPRVPCGEIRENSPYGAILSACTRRDPSQRFRSARSVLDAVLSVDPFYAPTTAKLADFITLLDGDPRSIPVAKWGEMADYIHDSALPADLRAIFMRLNEACITVLCADFPAVARDIGVAFARWVGESGFNFDSCDGLANRLEAFFLASNDYEVKAACLMAMLAMGTSHNRWYVERKFARLADQAMDPALAARLAIEFRVLDAPVCRQINHLEYSIGIGRACLHPALQSALASICR